MLKRQKAPKTLKNPCTASIYRNFTEVGAIVVALVVFMLVAIIQRSGSKRSRTMGIVRVMVNWMQAVRAVTVLPLVQLSGIASLTCAFAVVLESQTAVLSTFDIKGPSVVSRYLSFSSMGDGVSLNFFPLQVWWTGLFVRLVSIRVPKACLCARYRGQCALRNRTFYGQYFTYLALPIAAVLAPAVVLAVWSYFYQRRTRQLQENMLAATAGRRRSTLHTPQQGDAVSSLTSGVFLPHRD